MAEIPNEPCAFAVFDGDLDQDWYDRFVQAKALAVDTEAMGLIHGRDRLCLVQICDDRDQVACIRVGLGQTEAPRLKSLMEAQSIEKVFHFARFDVAALATGLSIRVNPVFCTKVGSRLARTYTPRHGLKDLAMELVGVELDKQAQSSDWGLRRQRCPLSAARAPPVGGDVAARGSLGAGAALLRMRSSDV